LDCSNNVFVLAPFRDSAHEAVQTALIGNSRELRQVRYVRIHIWTSG